MNTILASLRLLLAVARAASETELAASLVGDIFRDGRSFDDVSEETGMPKAEIANLLLEFSGQIACVASLILEETGATRSQ
ncbi:hypothetical protein [Methylobacterium platani]|uniref:hypothetical protein n=1 Tax=Methylobacterium platani TaxID=427683 RepID=UPI000ABA7C6A|nr:hypothetical protein [Methylobacterium platani]